MSDGGRIVPDSYLDAAIQAAYSQSWIRELYGRPPLPRRQRWRYRLLAYRARLLAKAHDALLGADYCDHDGCH